MPLDAELGEDTRRLDTYFGLEMLAVDYMVAADGTKHLLEGNHISNVTVFPEIRQGTWHGRRAGQTGNLPLAFSYRQPAAHHNPLIRIPPTFGLT
jgi:hypothetical protein